MLSSGKQVGGYRPDIDGLRALAVLLVVGFHAFPATLKAGFLGVDIFFVISGYLICGIILTDLEQGCFSFRDFYARRIRRIFPALLVVLTACLIAGWYLLLPDEYARLGKHVFGGSTFVSNLMLWQEAGYFDPTGKAKPLLHLWSLGIEEQYYIVFPLLLWLCAKRHLRAAVAIIAVGLLSFLDNLYVYRLENPVGFYSPLSRVWELLAGAALCAVMRHTCMQRIWSQMDVVCARLIWQKPQPNDGRSLGLVLAWAGLALLGMALLLARQSAPWPGWLALLPVIGTCCLIAAGPSNAISHWLLCNRLAIFTGKVSYPFYLWHWPLLSFAFICLGHLDSSTRLLRVGLVIAAFALAVLTHYLVENPIRFRPQFRQVKTLACILGVIVAGGAGLYVWIADGLPERPRFKAVARQLEQLKPPPRINKEGQVYVDMDSIEFCKYTNSGSNKTVAIIGDSHAYTAYHGVAKIGIELGYNTVLLGRFVPAGESWYKNINSDMNKIFNIMKSKKDIEKVFLSTRGVVYLSGIQNSGNKGDIIVDKDKIIDKENFKSELQNVVDRLNAMGKQVYIIGENPELPADVRDYVNRWGSEKLNSFPVLRKEDVIARQKPWLDLVAEIRGAQFIDVIDGFCPKGICMAFDGKNIPLYYDDDHLSYAGSEFQAEHILKPWLMP